MQRELDLARKDHIDRISGVALFENNDPGFVLFDSIPSAE